MAEKDRESTFIGPRIFSRRQVLQGLGAGAITLGVGPLNGCPNPDPRTRREVIKTYGGEKSLSYYERKVTEPPLIDYLTERAGSFGENCAHEGEIPADMELALRTDENVRPIDAGGNYANDLRLISAVDLERSPVLADYLSGKVGRAVTPENANAAFITTRFFATATTIAEGMHPTIGITDSVVATVQENSGQDDQTAAEVVLVDCAGVKDRIRGTYDKSTPPPGGKIDQTKAIPSRESLLNAYYDHLVGYNLEGEKVYIPFDPSESERYNPSRGSVEYGGVRVVEYRRVFPDLGGVTSTPPPSASYPDSPNDANGDSEIAEKLGMLTIRDVEVWPVAYAGGQTSAEQLTLHTILWGNGELEYSVALPSGAEPRKGDPVSWRYAGAWQCEGNTFDGCGSCCDSTQSNSLGKIALVGTSLATGCAFTGPAAPLCWLTAAVFIAGMTAATHFSWKACRDQGCNKTFYRVPGSPPNS